METKILTANAESISFAADLLKNNELVAIPTETVYGLAASSLCSEAVKKIFTVKGRPQDNPLISHICNMDMLHQVAKNIPQEAFVLAQKFWPGPLTMILPRADSLANEVCAGLDTAAVRMPSHPVALAIIKECGFPLAAPSANLSGGPSPTTSAHVYNDINGKILLIIDGDACDVGVESTVISLIGEKPILLRPGGITKEQVEAALGCEVLVSSAVLNALDSDEKAASPGMKYKHYAPKASVILIKGSLQNYNKYVQHYAPKNAWRLCFTGEEGTSELPCVTYGSANNPQEQANRLFAAMRDLDTHNASIIYVRCPEETGEALAVYNRLLRAAAFAIVEV